VPAGERGGSKMMAVAMDEAEELALRCCVCGTSVDDDSNYLNTKMKMLISKCGHRLYVPAVLPAILPARDALVDDC